MPSDPHVPIPRDTALKLWRESLERAWTLYRRAIPESQLYQIPYRDAVGFGDALGAATTDDEATQAIRANPKAAATFLIFATKLDEIYERDPSHMFELSVSVRDRQIAPFQILATATMQDMLRAIERDEKKQPPK